MILNEKDYVGGLKQWAGNHMKAAKDKAMAVAGSEQAVGRLNIRATTDELIRNWKNFCGQRKQAGVEGWDAYDPTMSQIEQFLKTAYNVDIDMSNDPAIADAAEAAGVEEGEPEGDDLKATTPNELDRLKRLATGSNVRAANPPGPAKQRPEPDSDLAKKKAELRADMQDRVAKERTMGLPTKESVELAEAERGGALLRKLFGTIALHMFDNGMVEIKRGSGKNDQKATIHSRDGVRSAAKTGNDSGGVADAERGTTVETRVDNNGFYLNALRLRDGLREQGVDGLMIHRLKTVLKQGSLVEAFANATEEEQRQMVAIAAVTVGSIQKAKTKMKAGENITRDGNTLNFNAFMAALKDKNVADNAFTLATSKLNKANADGEINQEEVAALMKSGDLVAKAILGIMAAMVLSIERVGKQPKAETPKEEKPAPAEPEKAEAQ